MRLWIDIETRSAINIKQRGLDVYSRSAEIILCTWAIDDGPLSTWQRGEPLPAELFELADNPEVTWTAHNAPFERELFVHSWQLSIDNEQWHCTMAQAYAHGLPGSLDALCKALGVAQKNPGSALIRLFCSPKKTGDYNDATTHPKEWTEFVTYNRQDVEAMRAAGKKMPSFNTTLERPVWLLDQKINRRGFQVDTALAKAAVAATAAAKKESDAIVKRITRGAVTSATQRDKMLAAFNKLGLRLPDLRKATITTASSDTELQSDIRALLDARREVSRSSTAKYNKVLGSVGPDERLRYTMQYAGAGRTGRWAGRTFQPHNLPRPTRKLAETLIATELLLCGGLDLYDADTFAVCSNALRGLVIAPPGKTLLVADWSSIEGRVLAWLAGEDWVLDAYLEGADMYLRVYEHAFGTAVEKADPRRQHGKVLELSMGYQGGVGAVISMGANYNVRPEELAKASWHAAPAPIRSRALGLWDWATATGQPTYKLSKAVYVGLQCAKLAWRSARPKTVQLWKILEEAAKAAVGNPGVMVTAGKVRMLCKAETLMLQLPSGRVLFNYGARIRDARDPDDEDAPPKPQVTFLDMRTGRRQALYGGLIAENITQASARDILAGAMRRLDAAGFDIVMHVHDEIAAEDEDDSRLAEMVALMCAGERWSEGLPLAVDAFATVRYGKAE